MNHKEYARAVAQINAGCHFDDLGRCRAYRTKTSASIKRSAFPLCCCHGCAEFAGYHCEPRDPLLYMARLHPLFDDDFGFWRPGGCVLDQDEKSFLCLSYICDSGDAPLQAEARLLVGMLDKKYKRLPK